MPRLIAIDMGSHAVKISTWRGSGRQYVLEERHVQPVPQDGDLPELEHRLAALDALLADLPALRAQGADQVVMALPSSEASFRRVAMPFTDRKQIEDTLEFAVENDVPFDLEDMAVGWRVAEVTDQTQVMTVVARRDRVSEWIEALAERELDPAAVHVDGDVFGPWGAMAAEPMPLDVLDAELAADTDEVPTDRSTSPLVAVVDVGHTHTIVSVVRDGTVQICRSINVGGHTFTQAIRTALSCTWAEAEAPQARGGARRRRTARR